MTDSAQMASTAVANALSGEKTFRTVQFAVTGNCDADAVNGICAVLAQPDWSFLNSRAKQRILEYLALRFKDEADAQDRFASYNSPNVLGGLGGLAAQQMKQQQYHGYFTSSGGNAGLANLGSLGPIAPPTASSPTLPPFRP